MLWNSDFLILESDSDSSSISSSWTSEFSPFEVTLWKLESC